MQREKGCGRGKERGTHTYTLATIQPVRGKKYICTYIVLKKSSKGKSRRHTGVHPAVIESIQNEVKQRRPSTKCETAAAQLWDAARGKGRAIYTHMRS